MVIKYIIRITINTGETNTITDVSNIDDPISRNKLIFGSMSSFICSTFLISILNSFGDVNEYKFKTGTIFSSGFSSDDIKSSSRGGGGGGEGDSGGGGVGAEVAGKVWWWWSWSLGGGGGWSDGSGGAVSVRLVTGWVEERCAWLPDGEASLSAHLINRRHRPTRVAAVGTARGLTA